MRSGVLIEVAHKYTIIPKDICSIRGNLLIEEAALTERVRCVLDVQHLNHEGL